MKRIKIALWGSLLLVTLSWLLSEQAVRTAPLTGIFEWRNVLLQYTGLLGFAAMTLAVMLATRPRFAEPWLNGLDKMYRLHKWLGIMALAASILHWLFANGPKWAVALGWLERRGRKPRPSLPEGSLQQWFASQRGLAEGLGEWAFYFALALMVLALIRHFPYRRFMATHKLLAASYLVLAFHALVLLKFDYWLQPVGFLMAAMLALGSISAVICLNRPRLTPAPTSARITALEWQPELKVLAVELAVDQVHACHAGQENTAPWPGHAAGQFAFVTFHPSEGAHPFTLASAWHPDHKFRFLIKALGDYTSTLKDQLKVGDRALLEGPFGHFTFAGQPKRQIWISGGIGITPFLARMQDLAAKPDGKQVDLFHCTAQITPDILSRLNNDARRAGVSLRLFCQTRLDIQHLSATVSDWTEADVWFCGPARFGQTLRKQLLQLGLPASQFHQELFEMR